MLTDRLTKMAETLFRVGAVEFGEFELKHHERQPEEIPSPIKFKLHTPQHPTDPGPLIPEILVGIASYWHDLIKRYALRFDLIAGLPYAGDAFADALGATFSPQLPTFRLLKKQADGYRRISDLVDPRVVRGKRVLLVDDVLTSGQSMLEATEVIQYHGGEVHNVMTVIDREQGGERNLQRRGIRPHAILSGRLLNNEYFETGKITERQWRTIESYFTSVRFNL